MERYNHRLLERKWKETCLHQGETSVQGPRVCALLIPGHSPQLELENARLLVLADFFAAASWKDYTTAALGKAAIPQGLACLALQVEKVDNPDGEWDLAVLPRDFAHLRQDLTCAEVVESGRLLQGMALGDLLADFGGDALRLYFLAMGPPARDYVCNWRGVVSAHRFVQKLWRLGQTLSASAHSLRDEDSLRRLRELVQARIKQKKPHTALAAVMGFLKDKQTLTPQEAGAVATLLRPFAPWISAELAALVAAVQDQNNGQRD